MRARAAEAGLGRRRAGQHLRGDRRGGAPGPPGDPRARRENPTRDHRRHRLRRPDRPRRLRRHARGRPRRRQRREADARRAMRRSASRHGKVRVNDIMSVHRDRRPPGRGLDGRTRAFVEVQNGCDHRCTFCVIPYGRGNSRSVPLAAVVDQVSRLADNGYREVVLTGVDITAWGADLPGARASAAWSGHPSRGARTPAPPPLLDRLDRGRRRADASDRRRRAADAASPPVAAARRRHDPEADEAPPLARRRAPLRRRGAPAPSRRRLRRRPDRRLPDRDRGDVREHAVHRRRMRP